MDLEFSNLSGLDIGKECGWITRIPGKLLTTDANAESISPEPITKRLGENWFGARNSGDYVRPQGRGFFVFEFLFHASTLIAFA